MKRAFRLFSLLMLLSTAARAQVNPDVEQGLKPFGAFQHGDIDSVSMTNGNLMVHIPLVSYPQRGGRLRLGFFIRSNGKGWHVYSNGISSVWQYSGGQVEVVPDKSWTATSSTVRGTNHIDGSKWNFTIVNILSSDGSSHEIVGSESIDASGIYDGDGLIDSEGVRYAYGPNYTGTTTDPNGNQIIANASGWSDTIGRLLPGSIPTDGTYGTFNMGRLTPGIPSTTANCPSGTQSARAWNLPAPNGGTAVIKLCYADFAYQTSFGVSGVYEASGTYRLLKAVVLPNLTVWQFSYNSYLDVTSITFPTGGSLTYNWGTFNFASTYKSRAVTSRTLNANDGTGPHTWNYQWNLTVGNNFGNVNVLTDPDQNDTETVVCNGHPCQVLSYLGSYTGGTVLKTVVSSYHAEVGPLRHYTHSGGAYWNVVLLSQTVTWPNGATNQVTYTYDPGFNYDVVDYTSYTCGDWPCSITGNGYYGKVVQQAFYDYGQGQPGALLKQVSTTYQWQTNSNYLTANLLSLVQSSKVLDAGGNQCVKTDYTYDDPSRLFIPSPPVTTQHVAAPGPKRGNLSSVTQQRTNTPCQPNASWTPLSSYVNIYDTGTTYQSIDPLNHTTTNEYSPSFAGAYATKVTNALSQFASSNYDFNTGLVSSATDLNGQITNYSYDGMSRLVQTNFPDTGQVVFAYTDAAPFKVTVTRKITGAMNLVTEAEVDGVGRVKQTRLTSDPQGTVYSDTTYDGPGRIATVNNPYRSMNEPTYGNTTTQYDALGSVTKVIPPDGTGSSNNFSTVYVDNCTTVTDQAGKTRKSCADALGRLTQVFEPNSSNSLINETDYQYDALDNLTRVDQKGNDPNTANWRTRTFSYNSLSQLLSASNPESGTISYTYDNDGNLMTKTDARGVTTCFGTWNAPTCDSSTGYDAVHRLNLKTYSDSTPSATYTYDVTSVDGLSIEKPIGRLVKSAQGSTGTVNSYDSMGRVKNQWQCTPVNCGSQSGTWFATAYHYNLAGITDTQTNPFGASGFTQTNNFDAAGRLTQITSSLSDTEHPSTLLTVNSSDGYFPSGAVKYMTHGNGLLTRVDMNNRLQPCRIRVTTSASSGVLCSDTDPPGDFFQMKYTYNLGTADNGNVMSWSASGKQTFTRNYGYDELNRISSMSGTGGSCPALNWTYDIWGNRLTQTGSGCTASTPTINTLNRIADIGYQYDLAGNMTADPGTVASYTYDAENRMVTSNGTLGNASYVYDANGRRIRKTVNTTTITDFIYDLGGSVIAERQSTDSGVNWNWTKGYVYFGGQFLAQYDNTVTPNTTYFAHKDHLGSTRLLTKVDQSTQECDGYQPFGELDSSVCTPVVGTTSTTHKFTGKERDTESGLDHFSARNFASSMGRFMIPDWSTRPTPVPFADLANPQSLNLYSYVTNIPLNRTDPFGHDWFYVDKKWQWQKGHTYRDQNGNATKDKGYAGLLVAQANGTDKKTGATTYKLTLYDQDKKVFQGNAFSGGNGNPAIKVGNYTMRLDIRDPNGPTAINPQSPLSNPPQFYGIQRIHNFNLADGTPVDIEGAYGHMRVHLIPWSGPDQGDFLHEQYNGAGYTHGCLCYGTQTQLSDILWKLPPQRLPVAVDVQVTQP